MYCGGEPEHHIRNIDHVTVKYILFAHKHTPFHKIQALCLKSHAGATNSTPY